MEDDNLFLLDLVELQVDVPKFNLQKGRIGIVTDIYTSSEKVEIEFRSVDKYTYDLFGLPLNQVLKTTKSPAEFGIPLLGIRHFLYTIGNPEWALLAVKAPLDKTAQLFSEFRKVKQWSKNIPKQKLDGDDSIREYDSATFIEVIDNEWTIVLRSFDNFLYDRIFEEAKFLSDNLDTQAICCSEEDTSLAMGFGLYDCGKEMERLDDNLDDIHSTSERLNANLYAECIEKSENNEGDITALYEFFDVVFRDLGIYVPACFPSEDMSCLKIHGVSLGMIDRVDIMCVEDS
jgi:Domain of unknown function (DUF4926)